MEGIAAAKCCPVRAPGQRGRRFAPQDGFAAFIRGSIRLPDAAPGNVHIFAARRTRWRKCLTEIAGEELFHPDRIVPVVHCLETLCYDHCCD
jgi:hypothetical protein